MYTVNLVKGGTKLINRATLERLRYLTDGQIKKEGYVPSSITSAWLYLEESLQEKDFARHLSTFLRKE